MGMAIATPALADDGVIRAEELLHPYQYIVYLDGVKMKGCKAAKPGPNGWVECYDMDHTGLLQCPVNFKRRYGFVTVERVLSI
jgi:hypothetical protein